LVFSLVSAVPICIPGDSNSNQGHLGIPFQQLRKLEGSPSYEVQGANDQATANRLALDIQQLKLNFVVGAPKPLRICEFCSSRGRSELAKTVHSDLGGATDWLPQY